jgi:N-acetylglucosamine malate deacetylase 1
MSVPTPRPDDDLDPVDLLVIGAHPDDAEYGMGGTLLVHARAGHRIGVVDLTRGELGSKGTPQLRAREAAAAAALYGASWRVGLNLGDNQVTADPPSTQRLARVIRSARPRLVFTHHAVDRHPDHRGAHELVRRAVFAAALRTLDLEVGAHVPAATLCFPTDGVLDAPDVVVDVTDVWDARVATMRCFASQFEAETLAIDRAHYGVDDYLELTSARARVHGQHAGVARAEAFVTDRPPRAADLTALFGEDATP